METKSYKYNNELLKMTSRKKLNHTPTYIFMINLNSQTKFCVDFIWFIY